MAAIEAMMKSVTSSNTILLQTSMDKNTAAIVKIDSAVNKLTGNFSDVATDVQKINKRVDDIDKKYRDT